MNYTVNPIYPRPRLLSHLPHVTTSNHKNTKIKLSRGSNISPASHWFPPHRFARVPIYEIVIELLMISRTRLPRMYRPPPRRSIRRRRVYMYIHAEDLEFRSAASTRRRRCIMCRALQDSPRVCIGVYIERNMRERNFGPSARSAM